jgi:hypothetical protein
MQVQLNYKDFYGRIELTYSEWGASATDITSFLGSGVLLLA